MGKLADQVVGEQRTDGVSYAWDYSGFSDFILWDC